MESLFLVVKPQGQDEYGNLWSDGRLRVLRTHTTIVRQCWAAHDAGRDVFIHLAGANQVIAQVEIAHISDDGERPEVTLTEWRAMNQRPPAKPYGRGYYWA